MASSLSCDTPSHELRLAAHAVSGLAKSAATGELAATRALLCRISPTLARAAAAVLGSCHPELDDVVQRSRLALLRALPAFRGDCELAGYASRIAKREAIRLLRTNRREARRRELLDLLSRASESVEPPEVPASTMELRELLRRLLATLPLEQAEALGLRAAHGWTLGEIARATGAPTNTVRSRIRMAKAALRRRMDAAPELAAELRAGVQAWVR
jgi:RNA polymerase sigma factor (sigma-70 family)